MKLKENSQAHPQPTAIRTGERFAFCNILSSIMGINAVRCVANTPILANINVKSLGCQFSLNQAGAQ
jgi:hypothetical protein